MKTTRKSSYQFVKLINENYSHQNKYYSWIQIWQTEPTRIKTLIFVRQYFKNMFIFSIFFFWLLKLCFFFCQKKSVQLKEWSHSIPIAQTTSRMYRTMIDADKASTRPRKEFANSRKTIRDYSSNGRIIPWKFIRGDRRQKVGRKKFSPPEKSVKNQRAHLRDNSRWTNKNPWIM